MKISKLTVLSLSIVLILAISCKKEGILKQKPTYAQIEASFNYSADTRYYELMINDKIIDDSLLSVNTLPVRGYLEPLAGKMNRLRLKDVTSGTVVLDTMINLTGYNNISFLQLSANEKPFITGGHDTETTTPLNDSVKVRFIYTTNELPDSIYLKMYYTTDFATLTPIDHPKFSFARNNFSRYFTVADYSKAGNFYAFELYNATNDELIQKADMDSSHDGFLDGLLINTYLGNATQQGQLESYLLVKKISLNSSAYPNYLHYEEQYLYSQK